MIASKGSLVLVKTYVPTNMSETMSILQARTPPPRQLGAKETLATLTHWKTTFKTFYKRDGAYKNFMKEDTVWDPSHANYNQAAEGSTGKRTAPDMKEDLVDLLTTLAGYLPHSYLTDKIVSETNNWKEVWEVIYEHYGVQVTNGSFLDFESLMKQTDETHRQFYERLLQHVKQHLAPEGAKVKPMVALSANKMSITLMNMVALQWLRKTNKDLIDVVQIEYSTELKGDVQLADLVPRIALNVDSLLTRYMTAATNKVEVTNIENNTVDNAKVNRTWSTGLLPKERDSSGRGRAQFSRGGLVRGASGRGVQVQNGRNAGPFCPSCYYLSQQLGTTMHFLHVPSVCPRKAMAVKMLQMEDNEHFADVDEEAVSVGKITTQHNDDMEVTQLQAPMKLEQSNPVALSIDVNIRTSTQTVVPAIPRTTVVDPPIPGAVMNINVSDMADKVENNNVSALVSAISNLQDRRSASKENGIRKEKSPMVPVLVNARFSLATIDKGSEINCMDEGFAIRSNVNFVPTICRATAAGLTTMKLVGQTKEDVIMEVQGTTQPVL